MGLPMNFIGGSLDEVAVSHDIRISRLEEHFCHLLGTLRRERLALAISRPPAAPAQPAQPSADVGIQVDVEDLLISSKPTASETADTITQLTLREKERLHQEIHNIQIERIYFVKEHDALRKELYELKEELKALKQSEIPAAVATST